MGKTVLNSLIDFGLSEKEARTYTALVEFGSATVYDLAKRSGVNRSSSYVVLESLRKRGLISVSGGENVRRYVAASPDTLLRMADYAAKEQTRVKNEIMIAVSQLKSLQKDARRKPTVRVFDGAEGVMAALEESLYDNREKLLRICYSHKRLVGHDRTLFEYLEGYVKARKRLGIRIRSIQPYDELVDYIRAHCPKGDKVLFLPEERYSFPSDMAICDDRIGYLSTKGSMAAVVVENKEMADLMKSVFDMAWKEAERLAKAP